ncbi:MAG: hypothetical protein RLZZ200_2979 [Pseudomonadota bacterium]
MGEARVTIVDVARRAGVSIKTVSRVINREPHVRPPLREKVELAISKLGYVPNSAARALSGSRSFVVAALFSNPSLHYIAELQKGALRICRERGYHLVIEQVDDSDPAYLDYLDRFLQGVRLDGVILSPPLTDDAGVMERLDGMGIPYVRIAPLSDVDRSHALFSDDRSGAALLARHLASLGHRRFGLVTGPDTHLASYERRQGFLDELAVAGFGKDAVEVIQGDYSYDSGMAAGIELLAKRAPVTAVFSCNDDMASAVIAAATRLGVKVPDELSVVGFDDSPVATQIWPPITTIRQPIADMSAEAARLLIDRVEARPCVSLRFEISLVDRKSTGINKALVR